MVAVDRLLYDVLAIRGDSFSGLFVQLLRIDRLAVLDYDVGLLNLWNMLLEHKVSVVQADRYDGAACFFGDLEGTAVEGEHAELFPVVAGALREDTDRDSVLHVVDGRQDALKTFFRIVTVQEEAVQALHPVAEDGIAKQDRKSVV